MDLLEAIVYVFILFNGLYGFLILASYLSQLDPIDNGNLRVWYRYYRLRVRKQRQHLVFLISFFMLLWVSSWLISFAK